jgi:antitoxin component of MazEF toxin-antitoxin module
MIAGDRRRIPMKAEVIRIGDELALILPNEIVTSLDIAKGQRLYVRRLADGGFRVGANDPEYDKGMRIAERVMAEYAETFKALAKS